MIHIVLSFVCTVVQSKKNQNQNQKPNRPTGLAVKGYGFKKPEVAMQLLQNQNCISLVSARILALQHFARFLQFLTALILLGPTDFGYSLLLKWATSTQKTLTY